MVTDGESLLADDGVAPRAEELLFALPRPTSSSPTAAFAGIAAAVGLEVVAFADLDALALAVAAWRGLAVRVVPLDEHAAAAGLRAAPRAARRSGRGARRQRLSRRTRRRTAPRPATMRPFDRSFATWAAPAYAPHSGKRDGMEGVSQWRNLSPRRGF